MNAPLLGLLLFGIGVTTGAVIVRDESADYPLEYHEHPTHLSSISISQNYENQFWSEMSSSASALATGMPHYLHQGNNLFFNPQVLLPGSAPSIATLIVPSENKKADCDQKVEEPPKYEEPLKPEEIQKPKEPESHDHLVSVSKPEQEVFNDVEEKEPIVIPSPPELPPLVLPVLPVPVDIPSNDHHENDENINKPLNDEMPTSSEMTPLEDSKPSEVTQGPEVPSFVEQKPIKVPVKEPVQPPLHEESLNLPCEQPVQVIVPVKQELEIPKDQESVHLVPSTPAAVSFENHVIHNELTNNLIAFPDKVVPKPIFISVIGFPQMPLGLPNLPMPQPPFNVNLPNVVPVDTPPCPPELPHKPLIIHEYVKK